MRLFPLIPTVALGLLSLSLSACHPGSPPSAPLGAHQPTSESVARARLVAVLEAGDRAMLERDAATLNRLFADDLVVITPVGSEMGKAELLAPFSDDQRPSPLAAIASDFEGATLRIYGSTALMSVRTEHTFNPEIGMAPTTYRNTYVFTHEGDAWRIRALHGMRLP